MKRTRSRIAAVAAFVGIFPALFVAAVLLFQFSVPVDGLRGRIATALSDALGCPLTINGSLQLVTGTRPELEGGDVRLGECRFLRVARASADMVGVRVSLWALFSHEIRVLEITGDHLEVEIPTEAPPPVPAGTGGQSRWSFTGISRLDIAPVRLLVRSASAPPRVIELSEIEGKARAGEPMQLTLRGLRGGEPWAITATTASLQSALAGPERWPLDLDATYAGAKLTLRGSWTPAPIGVEGDLTIATASAEQLLEAVGAKPPKLGAMKVESTIAASASRVALEKLHFTGPVATISGEARVTGLGARPMVTITLSANEVDYATLRRWRSAAVGTGSVEEALQRTLERLRGFDAVLTTSFARLTNAPFEATDAKHTTILKDGLLKTTNTVTIDGTPGSLSLDIDARGPFAIEGRAEVKAIPHAAVSQARDLAKFVSRIGGLSATLSARGPTVKALLDDVHGRLTGNGIGLLLPLPGERREARLRTVELTAGRGEAIHASATGTLAGEPLELELVGGPLVDLLENRAWPVTRLHGRLGATRLQASGRIEHPRTAVAANLDVDIATSRLDQLGPLVGDTRLPSTPGTLRGSIDLGPDAWRIDASTLAIGATRGSGHAEGKRGVPIVISLEMRTIDGDELAAIGGSSEKAAKDQSAVLLPDLDLSLKARRASYRSQAMENLAFDAQVRDGVVRGPFSLDWSGAKLEGTLDAALGKETMRIGGVVTARGLDLTRIPGPLERQGISGKIGRVTARVEASATSPEALPAGTAVSVEVADARVAVPKSDALPDGARFTFSGKAQATAGAPIDLSLNGSFRGKPISLGGRLPPLDALYPAGKPSAIDITIDYDRTRLEAEGTATIDNDTPKFSGSLRLSGDTLHTLADLAGFSARGFGPYAVSANVDADSKQVSAHDVAIRLGKSRFHASLSSMPSKARPRISAKVSGKPVHLEDIGAQALSPESLDKRVREDEKSGGKFDEAKLDRDARVLTDVLRALDFDVDVTFDELSAAGEPIGRADLKAKLADGLLRVDPLSLWLGEGKVDAKIDVDVRGEVPRYAIQFEGNGFEYGPLLRAVDPKSLASGTLDLSLDVKSSGAPERLTQNASGTIDVLILPKNQQAGRLDALGAGVLRLIMGALDPRGDSRLNCMVGSFDVADGYATSRIVLLDTTRARVVGELTLDIESHGLNGRLAPQSKRPQLFSVVPGIQISGTVDAPVVGITASQVVVGMLNIWKVPFTFTADWLTRKDLPEDGTPDCRAAYRHVLQ